MDRPHYGYHSLAKVHQTDRYATKNLIHKYSECLNQTTEIQTMPKPEWRISAHSDFSMFGFQTVSEIQTFECVPLASKWLATGFLVLF